MSRTERTVTLYSQGVNQSSAGVDKVNAIINCHLLTGRIGRPGMGPFSITGQPNAMGGREVGALANTLAAHMDFAPADIDRVGRFWKAPRMATKPGLKAVDLFEAVGRGEIKAIWIMATNPVASLPNADAVRAALEACELSVVSEAIRATDTVDACRFRLPALAWAEKDGTVTSSERGISRQRPFLPSPGEARQDWRIIADVARRLGHGEAFAWTSLPTSSGSMRRSRPSRMAAHVTSTSAHALRSTTRRTIHCSPSSGASRASSPTAASITCDRRARFVPTVPRGPATRADVERPLRLNTGRVRDQWHTMTRTGKSARLAGHRPEPTVEMHLATLPRAASPTATSLKSRARGAVRCCRSHVSDTVRPGEAFAPMHWTAQVSRAGRINAAVNPGGRSDLRPARAQAYAGRNSCIGRAVAWHDSRSPPGHVAVDRLLDADQRRGHHAYLMAGDQPIAAAQQSLSAALRASNPGPWLDGAMALGAVIGDGRLEAVMVLAEARDEDVRDRLAPFMAMERLSVEQRNALLHGGDDDRSRRRDVRLLRRVDAASRRRHRRRREHRSTRWLRRREPAPIAAPAVPRSASCCAHRG